MRASDEEWRASSPSWNAQLSLFVHPLLGPGEQIVKAVPVQVGPSAATWIINVAYLFMRDGILCVTDRRLLLLELKGIARQKVAKVHIAQRGEVILESGILRRRGSLLLRWPDGLWTRITVAIGSKELQEVKTLL